MLFGGVGWVSIYVSMPHPPKDVTADGETSTVSPAMRCHVSLLARSKCDGFRDVEWIESDRGWSLPVARGHVSDYRLML